MRLDQQDAVYKTRKEKLHAIVEAVEEGPCKGQPVLVGTITIEASGAAADAEKRGNPP